MVPRKLAEKTKGILEKERGTVRKPWGGKISVCLVYPNSYHVGMSNLGFQTLYRLLNDEDDVVCERTFLPDPEDPEEYEAAQAPLFSLESQHPLADFDLLGFSISFENDFLNILKILDLARIPKESHLRPKGFPLVMAGGVSVFLNPEPLSDFFDLFVLGEAEEVIHEFLSAYRQAFAKTARVEKETLLRNLSAVEGVYVPQFYRPTYREDGKMATMEADPGIPSRVRRRWVKDLDRFPTRSTLFTPGTEFKDMAVIEVNRGCPRGCRFCAACFVYAPFRNRSLSLLELSAKESLAEEPRIGLAGTAISDYPHLLSLCRDILSGQGGISLASLRVDAVNQPLIECLREGKDRTIAIAPEAGSERLRQVVKKGYPDEEILRAVDTLAANGLVQIKCYFLIGLPSETEEDVKAILSLARQIRHRILSNEKGQRERWRLVLSVNPFVPKPATPFQWLPMEEVGSLKKKLRAIERGVRGEKGMEVIHDLPKWDYVQALLSRGDRRVATILLLAHSLQGNWNRALRETNVNPDFYVYRWRDLDEIFPWDFIDHGFPKEKLKEEYLKAMKEAGIKVVE